MSESNNTGIAQKPKFSMAIQTDGYKRLINGTLGDPERARRFVAAITSAVAVSPALQECTPATILSAALLGESLNLSPSPQLGRYYLVPFKSKAKYDNGQLIEPACTKATFVLGYKGYLELALRSGQYLDIDCMEIHEGEYLGRDGETGKPMFKFIENDAEKESRPVVGYLAYFVYQNGFKKSIYWSREKMINHADQYSPAFSKDAVKTKDFSKVSFADYEAGKYSPSDEWKYSSFWYKQFDEMAKKTLLRQLISKWGIMSIEMQTVLASDNNVIGKNTVSYLTGCEMADTAALPETDETPVPDYETLAEDDAPDDGETQDNKVSINDI